MVGETGKNKDGGDEVETERAWERGTDEEDDDTCDSEQEEDMEDDENEEDSYSKMLDSIDSRRRGKPGSKRRQMYRCKNNISNIKHMMNEKKRKMTLARASLPKGRYILNSRSTKASGASKRNEQTRQLVHRIRLQLYVWLG